MQVLKLRAGAPGSSRSSKGLSQAEIAEKLAVNQSTASRDLQEMRKQSRKEIRKRVIKDALSEFYRWAAGMDKVTKKVWEIVEHEKAAHKSKCTK